MIIGIVIFIVVCLLLICLWVMVWDSNRFVVKPYQITSDKIKQKLRLVFLSDLHNKEYGLHNERLLAEIDARKPDLILVGGDILTAKPKASPEKAVHFMKALGEKYQVYYALGNHEYRAGLYPETYGSLYEDYRAALECESIHFLDNEKAELPEYGVCLTGLTIDRYYYKRFIKRKMEKTYLRQVLGQPSPEYFQILMAHNPEYFRDYASWTKDLVLAGHVHGGVARLPFLGGVIAPSLRPFPHYDGGIFEEFGSKMILSRGLGMHTIPVRFLNPGELVVIDLEPEQ